MVKIELELLVSGRNGVIVGKQLVEESDPSVMATKSVKESWERMTSYQVRVVKEDLGTERIRGRHVNSICRAGGNRFHGKVHHVGGVFYLEPKDIGSVRAAMEKEGYTPPKNKKVDGSAWGLQGLTAPQPANCTKMPIQGAPKQPLRRGERVFYVRSTT